MYQIWIDTHGECPSHDTQPVCSFSTFHDAMYYFVSSCDLSDHEWLEPTSGTLARLKLDDKIHSIRK